MATGSNHHTENPVYYEFPPIFKAERTRWGDRWDDEHYPTPEPLLSSVEKRYQQKYKDEAVDYTWMCYAQLKAAPAQAEVEYTTSRT